MRYIQIFDFEYKFYEIKVKIMFQVSIFYQIILAL